MKATLFIGFIKNNWKTIAVGVIAILVCIYGIVQFSNTIEQKKLQQTQNTAYHATLIDSVKSVIEKGKNAEIEQIKRQNTITITTLKEKIDHFQNLANSRKKISEKLQVKFDSLAKAKPECRDVADACLSVIDSLKSENTALDSVNYNIDLEAQKYSENWYLCEKQLKQANETINRKDSLISIKDNYISKLEKDKSKYWKGFKDGYKWGFGSAVVLETSALILLKR